MTRKTRLVDRRRSSSRFLLLLVLPLAAMPPRLALARASSSPRGQSVHRTPRSVRAAAPAALPAVATDAASGSNDNRDDDDDEDDWSAEAATTTSPYTYTPPSSLDAYGGSPQIRNAARAADGKGGTIVVAAIATGGGDGSVVCASLHRRRPGVRSRPNSAGSAGGGGSSGLSGRAMHVVSSVDSVATTLVPCRRGGSGHNSNSGSVMGEGHDGGVSDNDCQPQFNNPTVALTATGLRPDLHLLLTILRTHAVATWDRYDTPPSPGRISELVGEVFLTFLGYDRRREIRDGVGPVGAGSGSNGGDGGEGGSFRMARPFGLRTLILGVGWGSRGGEDDGAHGASIHSVGPSGVSHGPYVAQAVGRGSEAANAKLQQKWRMGMDVDETRALCVDVVRGVVREEILGLSAVGGGGGGEGDLDDDENVDTEVDVEGWEVICETLSARTGIDVRRMPLFVAAER